MNARVEMTAVQMPFAKITWDHSPVLASLAFLETESPALVCEL